MELQVVTADRNLGFAAAVNLAWKRSSARLLATLNDDAEAHPEWLAALRREIERSEDIGMCASQVRQFGTELLDSAGMLIGFDGSSKQRGQGRSVQRYDKTADVLLPSASAALYRREMIEQIGWMDEDFFLYCEDTDLGLRARWKRMALRLCARRNRGAPLLAIRRSGIRVEGVADRAQPLVGRRQELPDGLVASRAVVEPRAVCVARLVSAPRVAAPPPGSTKAALPALIAIVIQAHWSVLRNWSTLWRKRKATRAACAPYAPPVHRAVTPPRYLRAGDCAAVIAPVIAETGPNSLLVIVPALNEEGAIGHVVQSVHRELPGIPVLVIDDCSTDAHCPRRQAGRSGSRVASAPSRPRRLRPDRIQARLRTRFRVCGPRRWRRPARCPATSPPSTPAWSKAAPIW